MADRARTSAVTSVRPDPVAWTQAVAIVQRGDGDRRRIEVIDPLTLIVHNRPPG